MQNKKKFKIKFKNFRKSKILKKNFKNFEFYKILKIFKKLKYFLK